MTLREFEKVFKRLYVPLGMYALRIVEDIDDAEDIVQDSFIKTWRQLQQGEEIPNVKAYLYMSVRNGTLSFLKNKENSVDIEGIGDITEVVIDTSERDARLWKAIDRLPGRCREIFLMSKRDGLSNQEIAEELNLSIQTVKNQMSKALHALRDSLQTDHKPFFLPFL